MADNITNSPHKNVSNSSMFIDEPVQTPRTGIGRRRFSNRPPSPELPLETTTPPPQSNNDQGGLSATFENNSAKQDSFFHRRTMAYISLVALIILSFSFFFIPDPIRIGALAGAMTILGPIFGAIILGYFGVSTISFIKGPK